MKILRRVGIVIINASMIAMFFIIMLNIDNALLAMFPMFLFIIVGAYLLGKW